MSLETKRLYEFGPFRLDAQERLLLRNGEIVPLTPKAFDTLLALVENSGHLIEKDELMQRLWPDSFVEEGSLAQNVSLLRKTLGESDSQRFIETVPRRGYRFVASVKEVGDEGADLILEERSKTSVITEQEVDTSAQINPHSAARPQELIPPARLGGAKAGLRLSRSMLVAAAIILGAILVAALMIWKNQTGPGSTETTKVLRTSQVTTWTGLDFYPALSPDGNSIAYSSDHNGNFEIYVKPLTLGAREIQLTSDGEQNFEPTWSPDGKLIAYYSRNRGGIWVLPSSGGTGRQLTDFGSHPAWSPDGSLIVFESYSLTDLSATGVGALPPSTLWTVPSQGGDPTPVTQVGTPPGGHGSASWSPDGKWIVFISFTGATAEMWTVSYKSGDLKLLIRGQTWLYDPIYAPDGEHIYYSGVSRLGNYVLYKIRVSPTSGEIMGEPVEVTNTGPARIKHLTISSDGKRIAYTAATMKGAILSVPISPDSTEATGAPVSLTQDTSYRKGLTEISPDGRKIAFVEFRGGTSQDIWVMDVDGKNVIQLTTDPAVDWAPSWLAGSDQIAFQSNRQGKQMIWTVSIKSGREKPLVDPGQDIGWPAVSPDGKQIAFNSTKSGTINVWTVSVEGSDPKQLTFDKEQMGWPCWSPDGKLLAFQVKRGDDTNICVMPSSGGEITQLSFDHGQSWAGSWSPDGDKIAFAGLRNGYWNIWWISRTTKQQKQVTNYTKLNTFVRYPAWSPLGNQIVYEYAETTGNIWLMELK
jgi:Tol biopolymer transport system component/DNA-binding winged helix-turn-helix (wHTH) protein